MEIQKGKTTAVGKFDTLSDAVLQMGILDKSTCLDILEVKDVWTKVEKVEEFCPWIVDEHDYIKTPCGHTMDHLSYG